jgi:outer membrane immunogenic protein
MKKILVAGLVAGAWTSGALAADLGPYTPPPPAHYEPAYEPVRDHAYSWRGFYLGANGGYAWGNSNSAYYDGVTGFGGGNFSPDGWYGGGQIGYNAQFNWLVLGIEADMQGADIGDTAVLDTPGAFTQATTDINWFSTVRGRVGYAAGPALIYFTGGWAFADVSTSVTSTDNIGTVSMGKDDIKSGYTLGGGLEWAFAPNWSLKTEYLYVDLGKDSFDTPVGAFSNDTEFHTVRAGLNFRF